MKKILLLLILLLIPIFVCAKDEVSIESVDVVDKSSDNVIVNINKKEGLSVDLDVKFNEVNDFVKFKIIVDNPTDKDYEISEENNFSKSDYITYEYEYENNDRIAKKSSKTTMYVTIKFEKALSSELIAQGVFEENNKMVLSLGNGVKNPNTKDLIAITFIILIISLTAFLVIIKKHKSAFVLMLLIPITVFALEKIELNLNTKITINDQRVFYIYHSSDNTIETINYSNNKEKFNIVSHTKNGYLYDGYYSDYRDKGSYNNDGVYVEDATPFTGEEGRDPSKPLVVFKKPYLENGSKMTPEPGTTYYLKELPNKFISAISVHSIITTATSKVDELIFFSPIVSSQLEVGYIINGETVIGHPVNSYGIGFKNGETVIYDNESEFGINNAAMIVYRHEGNLEINTPYYMYPYYITKDGIKVISKYGLKIMTTSEYDYGYTKENIEADDYTIIVE